MLLTPRATRALGILFVSIAVSACRREARVAAANSVTGQQPTDAGRAANEAVVRRSRTRAGLRGMGTTLSVALSVGDDLLVTHVGDSRVYLLREGELCRLTRDHTADPAGPGTDRFRHVLTQAIGLPDSGTEPDLHHYKLAGGDRLLLCTDGLVREGGEDRVLLEVISRTSDIAEACDQLVGHAKARGARDNITAVVARFGQAIQAESEPSSSESEVHAVDPNVARLKSTSEFPQQFVA